MKLPKLLTGLLPALFFLCPSAGGYELPSSSGTPHIYFEADKANYHRDDNNLQLDGNVKIFEKDRTDGLDPRNLRGENFSIFLSSRVIVSSGAVLVEEGFNAIYGEDGYFDWEQRTGRMSHVNAQYGNWRVTEAQSAVFDNDKHTYSHLDLTSCNLPTPHYHFSIGKMSIIPNRRLFATNAVFYLGRWPVFYLPVLYKPLGTENAYITYVSLGYDESNGATIKTSTVYQFNRNLLGKLYLDYFSKRTFGTGFEMTYNDPSKFRGSLTAYRIREPGADSDRWGVAGGYWYQFNKGYSECPTCNDAMYYTQSQLRLVSDPSFNNDFFRSNPYTISTDRQANAAIVRQTKRTTTRLSYIRTEQRDGDVFVKTLESRPRLDFQTAPFFIAKTPFANNVTAYFENSQSTSTIYYQPSANARWSISHSLPLMHSVSIKPSVYYDQTVFFSPKDLTGKVQDTQAVGRYGLGATLRKTFSQGTLDLTQSYAVRLATNTMSIDSNSNDEGREVNLTMLQALYRPSIATYMRFSTGYDYRMLADQPRTIENRIQPLTAGIGYTPKQDMNFFLQESYAIDRSNQGILLQSDFGKPTENGMGFGFSHYSSEPLNYYLSQTIRWYPAGKSWYIHAGLGYELMMESGSRIRTASLYSKNIGLFKNFHDFHMEVRLNMRPGVKAVSANVNMRFNAITARNISQREDERFWHPWRPAGELRD